MFIYKSSDLQRVLMSQFHLSNPPGVQPISGFSLFLVWFSVSFPCFCCRFQGLVLVPGVVLRVPVFFLLIPGLVLLVSGSFQWFFLFLVLLKNVMCGGTEGTI